MLYIKGKMRYRSQMKKLFVSYSNCQGGGVLHFLKKTTLAKHFEFVQINNWQLILLEQSRDWAYEQLKSADVLIFQYTGEMVCTDGVKVPSTLQLMDDFKLYDIPNASFGYQFNHGFFPVISGAPGRGGFWTGEKIKQFAWEPCKTKRDADLRINQMLHDHWNYDYGCARRFVECLAEQNRREQSEDVSVKMVPWILENYRQRRLFLCQNHLTTCFLIELARRLITKIKLPTGSEEFDAVVDAYDDLDRLEKLLDDDDYNVGGTLPVHPAVVRELGLEYPADPPDTQVQYTRWLEAMIRTPA